MKNYTAQKLNRGFTLMELLIVIVLIGVLLAILAPNFMGTTTGARANLLNRTGTAAAQSINALAQACGTSTAIAGNPIPAAGKTLADVVYGGVNNVAAAYRSCYEKSNIRPMREAVTANGTGWQVQSYPITLSGGGTAKISVAFATVPDEVTLDLAKRFDTSITALAASDTTSDVVRYGAAANGTRTVTLMLD